MTIDARFDLAYPGFRLDVDLQLPARGVTALFGSSGSGKTTLLRLIAGLERAAGGRLRINDETWQDDSFFMPAHQRPLGYVFQDARLFPHLSVRGNLEYGRKRAAAGMDRNALNHAVELLGIDHLLDRVPDRLSGGERQRVAIARALATTPRLLLMDEPLAALDVKRKREIMPYLERLHDELAIPLLYVSHAPDEVARFADHLVVLDNGRVLANGPLGATLARLDLPISLGEDAGVVIDATVGAVDEPWHLMRVDFPGGSFWARDHGLPLARKVRVRVLARDVSLAKEQPGRTSIQNVLQGHVDAIGDDDHPGSVIVRIQVGGVMLLAKLTKRAATTLDIAAGQPVWVQVKSVALLE